MLLDKYYLEAVKREIKKKKQPILILKFVYTNFAAGDHPEKHRVHGFTRFTKWGELGEFIPLPNPSKEEEELLATDRGLMQRYLALCEGVHLAITVESLEDTDDERTLTTAATSMSTNDAGTMEKFMANVSIDDGEEEFEDKNSNDSFGHHDDFGNNRHENSLDDEPREGDGELHAMASLGIREEGGKTYWTILNSWQSMGVIEMSTKYLTASKAYLVFLSGGPTLRDKLRHLISCCP